MNKGMMSRARDLIIHDMEEMHAPKGWRIEIVFDAFGKNTNAGPLGDAAGSQMTREHPNQKNKRPRSLQQTV